MALADYQPTAGKSALAAAVSARAVAAAAPVKAAASAIVVVGGDRPGAWARQAWSRGYGRG